ncbi:type II secretion system GspH family protein [Geobacter hydrogenophilus]|nr:type II secretion system protein [Geobacter hydrogenophilus]MBT0893161.1 type II secretion system GspH family protein [Geobacter hydrogenophilus]
MRYIRNRKGLSFIELIMTVTILGILATVVVPFTQMTVKRNKELELRRSLREIRTAIDEYKKAYDDAHKGKQILNETGYPETLEVLVTGTDFGGEAKSTKKKFLRRIPVDPFNRPASGEKPEWGLRSYKDEPDSTTWDNSDVYDVYSLSEGTAIDGTKYKDW